MKIKYLLLVSLGLVIGCSESSNPTIPSDTKTSQLAYSWITTLGPAEGWNSGIWKWSYSFDDSLRGHASLELGPLSTEQEGWEIKWSFNPALPENRDHSSIILIPEDETCWHNLRWPDSQPPFPIPLPRVPTDSTLYSDLLALLKEFTFPFFNQVVTHWPQFPVPIRLVPAISGPIDLAACLSEAAAIWNDNELRPWFVIDSTASWGIRLVHFPDREMHPPLAAQITRLDAEGRPLRISLLVGNNYHSLLARPYVVRGFVHELGHALFLWGHSLDRIHCLWGLAPPMVSEPSQDERKAARWWHGLPDGLDLSQYGLDLSEFSSPSMKRASWPRGGRPSRPPQPSRHHFLRCPTTEEP